MLGSPSKATVMHYGVKAGGQSSKAKGNICYSDTYLVISDLSKLSRGISYS